MILRFFEVYEQPDKSVRHFPGMGNRFKALHGLMEAPKRYPKNSHQNEVAQANPNMDKVSKWKERSFHGTLNEDGYFLIGKENLCMENS